MVEERLRVPEALRAGQRHSFQGTRSFVLWWVISSVGSDRRSCLSDLRLVIVLLIIFTGLFRDCGRGGNGTLVVAWMFRWFHLTVCEFLSSPLCSFRISPHQKEDPNFHKYLQSEVLGTASDAVLGDPSTASQFQIVDGQLVQEVPDGTQLYAVVEERTDTSVTKLKVSWSTEPASGAAAGTFMWSGDTVEWSIASIQRPQLNVGNFWCHKDLWACTKGNAAF